MVTRDLEKVTLRGAGPECHLEEFLANCTGSMDPLESVDNRWGSGRDDGYLSLANIKISKC